MSDSLPFVKTVVEECSLFFYTLHRFCNGYVDKLNKRLGQRSTLDFRKKSEDMFKLSRTSPGSVKHLPRSPYILFLQEQTKLLKAKQEFVNYDAKKMSRYISKKWRHLTDKEKNAYQEKWAQLHESLDPSENESKEDNNEDNKEEIQQKDEGELHEPTIELLKGSENNVSRTKRVSKQKTKQPKGNIPKRKRADISMGKSFMENFAFPGLNLSDVESSK